MRNRQFYLGVGAFAVMVSVIALLNQDSARNAIAQETTQDGTATQDTAVQAEQNQQLRTDSDRRTTEYGQRDAVRGTQRAKHHKDAFKASELIGMNVRGKSGDDNIGSINDLMIHRNGKVNYVAVSFGGFLGIGDKLFAVPFEAVEIVRTDDDSYARIDVTEEKLQQREGFNQDNWPQRADKTFLEQRSERQVERPAVDQDLTR